MTKILIKQDEDGVYAVYSDCPNVEVVVVSDIGPHWEFSDGVTAEDFEATQHEVW